MNRGQERPGPWLLGRGGEDDAAGVGQAVDRLGGLGFRELRDDAAMDAETGLLGACGKAVGELAQWAPNLLAASLGSSRPRVQTRPGPARPANGWPSRASRAESR